MKSEPVYPLDYLTFIACKITNSFDRMSEYGKMMSYEDAIKSIARDLYNSMTNNVKEQIVFSLKQNAENLYMEYLENTHIDVPIPISYRQLREKFGNVTENFDDFIKNTLKYNSVSMLCANACMCPQCFHSFNIRKDFTSHHHDTKKSKKTYMCPGFHKTIRIMLYNNPNVTNEAIYDNLLKGKYLVKPNDFDLSVLPIHKDDMMKDINIVKNAYLRIMKEDNKSWNYVYDTQFKVLHNM
jgi:hypothetical protein